MIRLREVGVARGGRPLLEGASAVINPGERIALVGPNGSGKSTLLAAICGEVPLERGDIELPALRVVRLEQRVDPVDGPAWGHVLAADAELARASAAIGEIDPGDGIALAHAHDAWLQAGGPSAQARVRELLAGLGFSDAQAEQPVRSLSGGWQMRLNLARALFVPSDLLLLDEPTNHLDLDAIVWLERWLLRYQGTVITVSHDRDFLDRIATATLAIEDHRLVRYTGGYSACERQRAERLEQQRRLAASQAEAIARLQSFIDRFRAKATKARQAQSRLKALERIERVAPLHLARGIDFTLPDPGDSPDPLIVAEGLAAGYGERTVLRDVGLVLTRNARLGVLGRNGAGKSTLVRTLVGELDALAGECRRARSMRIGYFAQQGVESLRDDESPLAMLRRLWPDEREAQLRAELGRVGFSGDDAIRPIGPMSGGEKARLLLATILRTRPHLLVLDEPTNHLDADARDSLTDALADFEGALVLVSHDRYLMRASVDTLVLVHGGGVSEFDGDLDDYLAWLQDPASRPDALRAGGSSAGDAALTPVREVRVDKREERRLAAERRQALSQRLRPIEQRIATLESELAACERRLAQIDAELANPLLYRDAERATGLSRERAALIRQRERAENDWLEQSETREKIVAESADAD